MSKKRGKKLALKRETLRKLDSNQLNQAAGGAIAKTTYCSGGGGYGQSGGCTSDGCAARIDKGDYVERYNLNAYVYGG